MSVHSLLLRMQTLRPRGSRECERTGSSCPGIPGHSWRTDMCARPVMCREQGHAASASACSQTVSHTVGTCGLEQRSEKSGKRSKKNP